MPKYIISSDSPITARAISGLHPDQGLPWPERPVDPGYGVEGGNGDGEAGQLPSSPGFPERPAHPWIPPLPEWPPLPPGIALPIPPTPSHPIAPLPPDVDPPTVWPPLKPEFPDMSGKSIVLALLWVSRHEPVWGWVVVDHEEAKEAFKEAVEKIQAGRPQPK